MDISTNTTSIMMTMIGCIIITASNVWEITNGFEPQFKIAYSAANIASSIVIGSACWLTQCDRRVKRKTVSRDSISFIQEDV
jgi:hypothetical protein